MRLARGVLSVNELRARYFQLGPVPWGEPVIAPPDTPEPAPDSEGESVEVNSME
jgi:hypothetical protein